MKDFFQEHKKLSLTLLGLLLLVLLFWGLSRIISPAPPKKLVFTAGHPESAYYKFAQRYKTILAKDGITLEILTSAGSVENMQRLQDKNSPVQAGFVQGGLGTLSNPNINPESDDFDNLQALANVSKEPVWVFSRNPKITQLSELKGLRVAVGPEGSGIRKVALDLLHAAGLQEDKAKWLPITGFAAADAIAKGEIDAAIFVAIAEGHTVKRMITSPGVHLVHLDHTQALSRHLPYLKTVLLPRGVLDLTKDLPKRDATLLTTSTNLVVSESLHPALAYLLLSAAQEVHHFAGSLNRAGEFPNMAETDFPVAEEAKRYFTTGKPFLQRYMPFWAANFIQRLLLILIPLVGVVLPILRLWPAFKKFQQERKLFRLYGNLGFIQADLKAGRITVSDKDAVLAKLQSIDADIDKTKFAKDFVDRVYTLRQHVDFVRSSLPN